MKSNKKRIMGITAISLITLTIILSNIKLISELVIEKPKLQTKNAQIENTNAAVTYSRLADVVQIGDYVAYDATNNYSYTSPVGTGQSHGNGYSSQTFTSKSSLKWKVLSKNTTTGEVVLISEAPINTDTGRGFCMQGAIGYLYAEEELNKICNIYGHGTGANTSKTFTYQTGDVVEGLTTGTLTGSGARSINGNDINTITGYKPSTGSSYTHTIFYPTKTTSTGYSNSAVSRTDTSTRYTYNASRYISDTTNEYKTLFGDSSNMGYWLSLRNVDSSTESANFDVNIVSGSTVTLGKSTHTDRYTFTTDRTADTIGVRPIVYLKTNLVTSGKNSNGAWSYEDPVSPIGITLNKTNETLDLSGTKTIGLTATIVPTNANVNNGITWTSSNTNIAIVDANGVVTGIANGQATITATTGNGRTATCVVIVQTSPTGITLNKTNQTIDLSGEKEEQLTATIVPTNANVNNVVTWTSSNTNIATVDANGVVTGKANGQATITATTGNGKKATCNVIVQTSPTGITLNKTKTTLDLSGEKEEQLTATITPSTANINNKIKWTSSNEEIATIDETGKITAISNGEAEITITTQNGKTAKCKVIVQTSPTGITLNKTKVTLDLSREKEEQLTATISPETANINNKVKWTSSNEEIATIDETGKITAKTNGEAEITITTQNGKTATCDVIVQTSPTGITLNKTKVTLDMSGEKEEQLTATITPSTANINNKIKWTSSNEKIATVDETGKVEAISNGEVEIQVITQNGKTATCKVTVQTSPTEITLDKTKATLDLSGTKEIDLSVIIKENVNTNKKITWTSSDEEIATVDETGKVTAKTNGEVEIQAITENGKIATCEITIVTTPTNITLNKKETTLDLSKTKEEQLIATIEPETANISTKITWTSSNTNVATIDQTGKITAIANGEAEIQAITQNEKITTCKVTVITTPTKITLNKEKITLDLSKEKEEKLIATIKPETANTQTNLKWTSSNEKIAIIDQEGKITAKTKGEVEIKVETENGKTATCKVTIQTTEANKEDNNKTDKTGKEDNNKTNETNKEKPIKKQEDETTSKKELPKTGENTNTKYILLIGTIIVAISVLIIYKLKI